MTSAGVGVAIHADGFTAAGLAAHRALVAAGTTAADIAIVFAGVRHDDDEYAGVLNAVRRTMPLASIIGCSATGVLTGGEELENGDAVAVLALGGEPRLPAPLLIDDLRKDSRSAGAGLGRRIRDGLGGDEAGAAVAALQRALAGTPGLKQMTPHLLVGIGELGTAGRSDYVVRPFAVAEGSRAALAVAEPVRAGQTIRFTVRDAIGAREDMKAMLEEQAEVREQIGPAFGLYFNCAGRGSALYGKPGLDPELIRRRFGNLAVAGIESSFEIAPACGRT